MKIFLALLCLFALLLSSCSSHSTEVERSFYFWKSGYGQLTDRETECIKNLQVKNLYVKFFEVSPDPVFVNKPISKTGLHFPDYSLYYKRQKDSVLADAMSNLQIIPVVYVQNSVLTRISKAGLDSLADNIVFLIHKYYQEKFSKQALALNEIQIDCDWTLTTKDNYFHLLQAIKKFHKKNLSCTLRLYAYKYPEKMGIPPVERVSLMCYNLNNPLKSENSNSIQDVDELEKYLKGSAAYPLHTDIALPLFSWLQIYKNQQFAGLLNSGPELNATIFKPYKPYWYRVVRDTTINDSYLRVGDVVKHEASLKKDIDKTMSLLKKHIDFSTRTRITFFHLDEAGLSNYTHEELQSLYSAFSL